MTNIVADIIIANAERIPDRPAIVDQGRRYTFLQHADRVRQLVGALTQAGCRRQVCIWLFQEVEPYLENR